METIYRERLNSLRETLVWLANPATQLPRGYGFWVDVWRNDAVRMIDYKPVDCQTTLCLLGWHIHLHPDEGLNLEADAKGEYWPVVSGHPRPPQMGVTPYLAEYFGIPALLANRLFLPRPHSELYCTDQVGYARAVLKDLDEYLAEESAHAPAQTPVP